MTWHLAVDVATLLVIPVYALALLGYRRSRYRSGWLDGRVDLLEHMGRAHRDGLSFDAFIRQVAARDGFLIPEDPEAHRG